MGQARGFTLTALALLFVVGCGTGNRLDLPLDGPGGGQFLPVIHQVDSGVISLTDGAFSGGGSDLVLGDPFSNASVTLFDNTTVTAPEQIYDPDGDGDLDYFVITIRALSAQAAACVSAVNESGSMIAPQSFVKVGGAAFEPLKAEFSNSVSITLPISSDYTAAELAVYKFDNWYLDPESRAANDDIGTDSGLWRHFTSSLTDNGNATMTFATTSFGEYCIAVLHDEGAGTDI